MTIETHQKVNADHLKRNAYLYIRQSTPRQVLENTESTQRQYALRQRAVALGWPMDRIMVVNCDQGHSAKSTIDREGFQKLVAEVGMGRAGIVLGLEVSRRARNNADWHRLLEICALADTLILDEDGIYDPTAFNDRLLLGLKGTMAEAERHVMQARMRGGVLNKARRGELALPLPVGLIYNPEGQVILDPDQQVQQSLQLLFATFRRTGTACATVRSFREQGLLFRRRPRAGPARASCSGWNSRIAMSSRSCEVHATQERLSMAAPAAARRSMAGAAVPPCASHGNNGTPCGPTPTPAISAGKSTRTTCGASERTRRRKAPTAGRVRPERDRRCSKGRPCAGSAGNE